MLDMPTVAHLNIKKELTENYQRTIPSTANGFAVGKIWVDAQALQFEDDEDAESAAIGPQGQGGGEVSLAFDRGAERAPNDDQKRGGGKMARSPSSSARPRAEGVSRDNLERWERFVSVWQFVAGRENVEAAKRAFLALSHYEQELCIKGAQALQIPPDRRVFAVSFIRQRQWAFGRKGTPPAQAGERAPAAFQHHLGDSGATRLTDGKVFLRPGSAELSAWEEYERRKFGKAKGGCTRPTPWPPEDDRED
jgi:hypothetical protein